MLPASDLYAAPVYQELARSLGPVKFLILSAGWGLIPSSFLTPRYDITFKKSDFYKQRLRGEAYDDLCLLNADTEEPVVFVGGKDYQPFFARLTGHLRALRIAVYRSKYPPNLPGVRLARYESPRSTNWHYEAAKAILERRFDPLAS